MKKRLVTLLLSMAMVLGTLAGCSGGAPKEQAYSVVVTSEAGKCLEGVAVDIYQDGAVVTSGTTDAEGKAEFVLATSDTYKVVVSGLSTIYVPEEEYSFTETTAEVVIDSCLDETRIGVKNKVKGDMMYDIVITSSDGETIGLADLLAEKELVVLKFWYES